MNVRRAASLAVLATAALGFAASAQNTSSKNLVNNPTMDEALDAGRQLPMGWYGFGKSDAPFKVEMQEGRFETRGLHIESTGEYAGCTTNRVPVNPAHRYQGRAWVKIDPSSSGTAGVKFDFFDAAGKYLGDGKATVSVRPDAAADWQLISILCSGEVVPGAAQVALAMTTNGKVTAWFDDAEMIERDGADPANLLPDGGMEVVAGNGQSKWGLSQAQGGTVQRIRRRVPVKEGWYSMQLVGKAQWASSDAAFNVPLDRAKKYTLTGWIRSRVGKGRIKINYLKDGKYLAETPSVNVEGSQWQQVTVVADPAKYPEANQLGVGTTSGGGEVDCLFDDLCFKAE
jgi:hypothetical protein